MKKITYLIAILLTATIIVMAGCSNTTTGNIVKNEELPNEKPPINIGFISPLSGDAASYGLDDKHATEMAVEEINSQGGINGRMIKIIFEDGKCSGKEATLAAQKLINVDNVKIILGGGCSGETIAAAAITEPNKVILFSATSSSPKITDIGQYVFRNSPSDTDGGKKIVELMIHEGNKRIAILSENNDFAQALREVVKRELAKEEIEIVADENYESSSKDYRSQLTRIKDSTPDAIFFNVQNGISGGLSMKQAHEMKIQANYYTIMILSGNDALSILGNISHGWKFVDGADLNKNNPQTTGFIDTFAKKYSRPQSEWYVAARYDSIYILSDALKQCDEDTDCIKNYLYSMETYHGLIGNYSFDSNGDLNGEGYVIKQVIDAKTFNFSVVD